MDLVRRIDTVSTKLGRPVRRADGSMVVQARFARTGVQLYKNADGSTRREYRPADEVGHSDSIESLKLIPFTLLHPPVAVSAANASQYARGSTGESITFDGKWVSGPIVVQTKDGIEALQKMQQISVGYECKLDWTPGVSPEGEHYDCVQRYIRGNHVALVPDARAGAEAAVRMDASASIDPSYSEASVCVDSHDMTGDQLVEALRKALSSVPRLDVSVASRRHADEQDLTVRRNDGQVSTWAICPISVRVSSPDMTPNQLFAAVSQAISQSPDLQLRTDSKDHRMDTAALTASLTAALADVAKASARADAAEAVVKSLTADLGKVTAERDAERTRADSAEKSRNDAAAATPALVKARVALEGAARKILGKRCDAADGHTPEVDLDALNDRALKVAVIKHVTNVDAAELVKGRDEAYIEAYIAARYDAAIERASVSADTHRQAATAIAAGRADAAGGKIADSTQRRNDARAEMIKANRETGIPAKPGAV